MRATERLIGGGGAELVTVDGICAEAGVASRAFYAAFEDREDCLLAVFDEARDRAAAAMTVAYRAGGSWIDGVRRALDELLAFLDDRPGLAHFLIVDSFAGDARLRARRREALLALALALDADSPSATAASPPAPSGAEAVVGAIASILHARLLERPPPQLRDISGALTGVIVLRYLDSAAARRELTRRAPRSAA